MPTSVSTQALIDSLENANIVDVEYVHMRRTRYSWYESTYVPISTFNDSFVPPEVEPRGGATVCVVKNTKTGRHHIGIAVCSVNDNYQKSIGRNLSYQRAVVAARTGCKVHSCHTHVEIENNIVQHIPAQYLFD
jgi:hypothetical protein